MKTPGACTSGGFRLPKWTFYRFAYRYYTTTAGLFQVYG